MADGENHVEAVELSSGSESETETHDGTTRNLKSLEGATSVVWKFFGFDVDDEGRILVADKRKQRAVTCIRCNKQLRYTGGNSNLHFHLDKHHRGEYEAAVQASRGNTSL